MIKSKFAFFQMQVKSTFANASELIEPGFCDSPKVLNAVNMIMTVSRLIEHRWCTYWCTLWMREGENR